MTTVQTRVREISDLEGFDIIVMRDGTAVNTRANGVLTRYPFGKKLKHTKTVSDWRTQRFEAAYPGYTCDVLDADGNSVVGQTSLRALRESYEED